MPGLSPAVDTGLSGPSRAHLGLQLLDLVLELSDVLRRVGVVQLTLDAALLPLPAGAGTGVRQSPSPAPHLPTHPPSPATHLDL